MLTEGLIEKGHREVTEILCYNFVFVLPFCIMTSESRFTSSLVVGESAISSGTKFKVAGPSPTPLCKLCKATEIAKARRMQRMYKTEKPVRAAEIRKSYTAYNPADPTFPVWNPHALHIE